MRKSLLALAVLGAFAGAASAQSSVTVYGRVDLSVGKKMGTDDKGIFNGSGNRLGFRGIEDLGGGLMALFDIEHRFEADTGAQTNPASFWQARSVVGLRGGFGQITLGREYTSTHSLVQNPADPWGHDTIVSGGVDTDVNGDTVIGGPGEVAGGTIPITRGYDPNTGSNTIAQVRLSNSARYSFSASGFQAAASVAEGDGLEKRPWNIAGAYAGGPISVGIGYENPGNADDYWATGYLAYAFGPVKLGGFFGTGHNSDDVKVRSYMVTATAALGPGELRAVWGQRKVDDLKDITLIGAGYHYSLSKRTTIYVDVATNRELEDNKVGYDVGLKHVF
jgi:predicted porin